jgi:hypothetical protein
MTDWNDTTLVGRIRYERNQTMTNKMAKVHKKNLASALEMQTKNYKISIFLECMRWVA